MNNYNLEKRYRILDNGSVVEDGISDRKTALNHIIYKVNEIVKDCISCKIIKDIDADTAMKNRLRSWTIEEYDVIGVD